MEFLTIGKLVILTMCAFHAESLNMTKELESTLDTSWFLDNACQTFPLMIDDARNRPNSRLDIVSIKRRYRNKMKEKKMLSRFFDDSSNSFYFTIKGTWVSEICESRPGPSYVMRRYVFRSSRKFVSRQYHYKDISCSIPYYVISTEGRLSTPRPSWLIPGSYEADEPKITKVTIYPYSRKWSNILTKLIVNSCNGTIKFKEGKLIKKFQFYDVNVDDDVSNMNQSESFYEDNYRESQMECILRSLNWSSSEFQLFRYDVLDGQQSLSLGASRRASSISVHTRPTYFHQPLLMALSCNICNLVHKSKITRPPLLKPKYLLPLAISGVWSSRNCEIHSEAIFLNRRFIFKEGENGTGTWISKYSYFKDPNCHQNVFDLQLSGIFVIRNQSEIVHGTTNIDITTRKALLTPKNKGFLENLKNVECSRLTSIKPLWFLNQKLDLSPFGGCLALSLLIPKTHYDVARTEINANGATFLYLGYTDEDEVIGNTPLNRPTSIRFPLVSCHTTHVSSDISFNKLHPLSQAFTNYKSKGSKLVFRKINYLVSYFAFILFY